ncbi:tetratricopeptide repeat protein [Maribacter algarum]|uniref:Tetratricopeptide repeat protein n=1 Tax=Maribacter algarum (ex Zhang et al. 2020) TaxID=2578118 RepID=A0A5S3PNM4_9FLAO|nr:tetratricopeptide repeat protein [Maribacter algarum]TMM55961.1 tetratricopeptide repeat protein [Maribacter algarum]
MKKNQLLLFLFLVAINTVIQGQQNQKLDSLINLLEKSKESEEKADILNEIIQIELYSHPVEVKTRINELIKLSQKIDYKKGEANGYYRKGGYFLNKGILDSAEYYHSKSLKIHTDIKNTKGILNNNVQIALVYMYQNKFDLTYEHLNRNIQLYENRDSLKRTDDFKFIGSTYHTFTNAYVKQGRYNMALKSELKAHRLYKELVDDEIYQADALNSLGHVENSLNNYEQALIHLKEANTIFAKHEDHFFELITLVNLGNSYYGLKNYHKTQEIHRKGLKLAQELENKGYAALLWGNYGNTFEKLNQLDSAIISQKKSIELYTELDNKMSILHPYVNLGNLYRKTNRYNDSKYYLDLVIREAGPNNLNKLLALAYEFRSNLNEDINKPVLALEDYKKFKQYKDSLFDTSKTQQIESMRALFETEKKEQQIALQEKEITVLEQKASISNLQKLLLGIGLLLSFIGFYAIRQKMKRNKLEKEKVDAELEFKKKELTTHALNLARKNETLENLKLKAQELKQKENTGTGYNQLIRSINFDLQDDNNWQNFSRYFEEVHKDFNSNVKSKYPSLTSNELRLLALLKMNLSSKEIANILNISPEGIKKARYRLRKKLDLTTEDSLQDLVLSL